jgi:hypothetical protein
MLGRSDAIEITEPCCGTQVGWGMQCRSFCTAALEHSRTGEQMWRRASTLQMAPHVGQGYSPADRDRSGVGRSFVNQSHLQQRA